MRIKVGDLVEVVGFHHHHENILGLVTEVTNPQYGMPPVYWIKFVEDGDILRVQHSDIVRVIR